MRFPFRFYENMTIFDSCVMEGGLEISNNTPEVGLLRKGKEHMKNTSRRILCLLASVLIAFGSVSVVNAEEAVGSVVAFVSEHASVDIYYTQVYAQADETGVSNALARNSETGKVDISGDGQVNFKVNLEEGYVITSVKVDQNYKNVKDQGEGIYRVTKITGPVTVTVATLLLWYRRKAA